MKLLCRYNQIILANGRAVRSSVRMWRDIRIDIRGSNVSRLDLSNQRPVKQITLVSQHDVRLEERDACKHRVTELRRIGKT